VLALQLGHRCLCHSL